MVREALNPTTSQGNSTYEKTPRCPDGWSVRCRCFCTSPSSCTGTGSRPSAGPNGGTCACSNPGTRRQGPCQGQAQESGRQEGHEEDHQKGQKVRQKGRLICLARAAPPAWPARLLQNRPQLRAVLFLAPARPCHRFRHFTSAESQPHENHAFHSPPRLPPW